MNYPWAGVSYGRPDPQMLPENATDGHVVLLTDKGIMIDVTAAQFPELSRKRNGLPIIGRDPDLWAHLAVGSGREDEPRQATAVVPLSDGSEVHYNLYHPYLAAPLVAAFLNQNGSNSGLAQYLYHFVNSFVWVVANVLLTGTRAAEIDSISNIEFANKVRAAVGIPKLGAAGGHT